MKKVNWIRGIATTLAFIGSFFICAEFVAESSASYVSMVDSLLGQNKGVSSTSAEAFMYKSDYANTSELLQKRKEIGIQYLEEGSVLLKNNGALPLRNSGESNELKVTVLGTRAITYDSNGNLRDKGSNWQLSAYGGICGSRIYEQTVTNTDGTEKLPWTLIDSLAEYNIKVNPKSTTVYDNKSFTDIPSGGEASGTSSGPFSSGEPYVTKDDFGTEYSDAAIVMIGRSSGEGRDYLPGSYGVKDKTDGSKSALHLNDNERNLIEVAKQISDKVIVLINSAVAMEIEEVKNSEDVDSILWIGLPGAYGMLGVAKLLAGEASPSGHLTNEYASDNSVSPASINFGYQDQDGNAFTWSTGSYSSAYDAHYVVLAESIYDGYYYYETRYNDCIEGRGNAVGNYGVGRYGGSSWKYEKEVSYPFGYGLSYTTFNEEFIKIDGNDYEYDSINKCVNFKVKVTNTGEVSGKHVVQLYCSSPYTSYDESHHIEKSAIQLVDFGKTDVLEPGESQTLDLSADLKYIASYDETALHNSVVGGYILEADDYYFSIGNGAHEALNNTLAKKNPSCVDNLYKFNNVPADSNKSIVFNPFEEEQITTSFSSGINVDELAYSESGELIHNNLQEANYNYYFNNSVSYMSRSSYDTFPSSYPGLATNDAMNQLLGENKVSGHVYKLTSGVVDTRWGVDHITEEDEQGQSLENKVIAQYKGRTFDDDGWDYLIEQITFDEAYKFAPLGGSYCNELTTVSAPQVWQADGPNGFINYRLGEKAPSSGNYSIASNDANYSYISADMCAEPNKAATFNKELLQEEGKAFGENAIWSRTPVVWAPGMNLQRSPWNSRNHEYYSEDPILTNKCGASFVLGGLEKGAILSPKHFAFNTQECYREGLGQFMTEQYAREMELRAFQGAFEDISYTNSLGNTVKGSLGLMTSFSRMGVYDVNNHSGLMKNILRKEWGFKGLISTDYVSGSYYFNPLDCVYNNVTLMASGSGEIWLKESAWSDYADVEKVKSDPNINEALHDNMHYYLYAISNSSALNGYDDTTVVVTSTGLRWWQVGLYVLGTVTITISAAVFVTYTFANKKKKKEETTNE